MLASLASLLIMVGFKVMHSFSVHIDGEFAQAIVPKSVQSRHKSAMEIFLETRPVVRPSRFIATLCDRRGTSSCRPFAQLPVGNGQNFAHRMSIQIHTKKRPTNAHVELFSLQVVLFCSCVFYMTSHDDFLERNIGDFLPVSQADRKVRAAQMMLGSVRSADVHTTFLSRLQVNFRRAHMPSEY